MVGPLDRGGNRRTDPRSAHRADPLTSTPEHLADVGHLRTIDLRMDQFTVARQGALLEREHELEQLRAALGAAGRRAGAALVIEGAAGMGKSRLLEETRARASDLGV